MLITAEGTTLFLQGDFDVRSTSEVREAVNEALASCGEGDQVVVDLSGVDAVDVTALRLLAAASRRATRRGTHVRVRGCGPSVLRMLHISRLVRLLDVDRAQVAA